jgi:5-amino-6-(5-phospho-D-ribitylamino)uracil phosphatase
MAAQRKETPGTGTPLAKVLIRLIAVDLDGTLLRSDRTLAPRAAQLLRQAQQDGIYVVLATTRNPEGIQEWYRDMQLTSPIIGTNGAQVWASPLGPVWIKHTIPQDCMVKMASLADEMGWELVISCGAYTYFKQRPGQALGPMGDGHRLVVQTNLEAVKEDAVRVLTWQPEAITALRDLCETRFKEVCRAETYYNPDGSIESLGVFPLQADKGKALALVCERLGISGSEVMAIGDNPVDLPMFTIAGLRVAMGNATPDIKQAADWIAPTNDEEGVAWAVERVIS